jgi:hypothetical protein
MHLARTFVIPFLFAQPGQTIQFAFAAPATRLCI